MSVNSYKQGCHLLNHDDVIGVPLPLLFIASLELRYANKVRAVFLTSFTCRFRRARAGDPNGEEL